MLGVGARDSLATCPGRCSVTRRHLHNCRQVRTVSWQDLLVLHLLQALRLPVSLPPCAAVWPGHIPPSLLQVLYAIALVPMGFLADQGNRPRLLAGGLAGWSLLTMVGSKV